LLRGKLPAKYSRQHYAIIGKQEVPNKHCSNLRLLNTHVLLVSWALFPCSMLTWVGLSYLKIARA